MKSFSFLFTLLVLALLTEPAPGAEKKEGSKAPAANLPRQAPDAAAP